MLYPTIVALLLLAIIIVGYVFLAQSRRKLRGGAQRKVREVWLLIEQISDPAKQIMEADKVLDLALNLSGYKGTTGEKMKAAGPRFRKLNDLWAAHKLRNELAHEIDAKVDRKKADRALAAFKQALKDLGM